MLLQLGDQSGDLRSGGHQVGDEALQVVDQAVLVGAEDLRVGVVQVDRALQRAHEGLRVRGQVGEPVDQGTQRQMHLRRIGIDIPGELTQRAQLDGDVGERDRLQRPRRPSASSYTASALHRLALAGELVEEPGPVEVLDAGHPAGVRVGAQVAPALQSGQRVGDGSSTSWPSAS